MHTIRPGRVAALLAVLALLLAAIPAAAAPPMTDRPVESATGARAPLVHALADWLTALWSGFGPQAAWEKLGLSTERRIAGIPTERRSPRPACRRPRPSSGRTAIPTASTRPPGAGRALRRRWGFSALRFFLGVSRFHSGEHWAG